MKRVYDLVQSALSLAVSGRHSLLTVEHLLLAAIRTDDASEFGLSAGDAGKLERYLSDMLATVVPQMEANGIRFPKKTHGFRRVTERLRNGSPIPEAIADEGPRSWSRHFLRECGFLELDAETGQ